MSEETRLFDRDEFTGITEYFIFDDTTGGFMIESQQDVEPLIELNKTQWNAQEKHTKYRELTRVASIPNVVMMELSKKGIVTPAGRILDDKKFRAWLNDRDNMLFRTRPGKV